MVEKRSNFKLPWSDSPLKDNRKHVVTLCVKRMPSPHTAVHIREKVEEVLRDWEFSDDKVSLIITDSGSNMVAAFRNLVEKRTDAEEEEVKTSVKRKTKKGIKTS